MSASDAVGTNPSDAVKDERADAAGTSPSVPSTATAAGADARPAASAPARRRFRLPTALLLTCAALGVAGGILLAPANWLSTLLFATVPFASVAVAGLWLVPSVVALRLLRKPLVGLLVGLLAGLVIVPFTGDGIWSVSVNLWWAAFAELPFFLVIWRYWGTWLHYLGAVVVGVVYPVMAWVSFDLGSFSLGVQVVFFALSIASCVGATAVGILIADRLRKAGVGRR